MEKTLESKRVKRGFVPAIGSGKDSLSDYTLCLKDLEALSCEPELDLLPIPETIESLKLKSELFKAQAQAEADALEAANLKGAQEDGLNGNKPTTPNTPTTDDPAQSNNSPGHQLQTTNIQNRGNIAQAQLQSNDNHEAPMNERVTQMDRSASGNGRSPPQDPPTFKPRSTTYSHDDYDQPNRKRARGEGMDDEESGREPPRFITAKQQQVIENQKNEQKRANHYMNRAGYTPPSNTTTTNQYSNTHNTNPSNGGGSSSTLKTKTAGNKKFKSPINKPVVAENNGDAGDQGKSSEFKLDLTDDRLKNIDPRMIEAIQNEIMDTTQEVTWNDISGLEHAKKSITETITWPMLRPDIFTGLRGPAKGLLLFGPPGTGKTMIGKCIASQSKATFFSISSSSLTSKWVGDGEKMVRALFAVARCRQPAVIFMDEIDSLLSQRSDGEVEASRRIKTEFLVQFDGAGVGSEDDRILIIGATNRPQEIDEAARRRFQKRLYIPLPETIGRRGLILKLLESQIYELTGEQLDDICDKTAGYSGSDMNGLCREAALGPIRDIAGEDILQVKKDNLRPIMYNDFINGLLQVRASVSDKDLDLYKKWDQQFGSMAK
ncbi:hypothetical protein BGZ76_010435 [Entomortierella beljakovae]|nr:hypothetical protein BGZ76_010435 [Entomortierella beljakovae]